MPRRKAKQAPSEMQVALAIAVLAISIISAGFFVWAGLTWEPTAHAVSPAPSGTTSYELELSIAASNSNYDAWVDCTDAGMTTAQLDAFCSCKGSSKASKCWFEEGFGGIGGNRFIYKSTTDPPYCIMTSGQSEDDGSALIAVACGKCDGTMALSLPSTAPTGSNITATVTGPNDICTGKDVYVCKNSCSQEYVTCSFSWGTGNSCNILAPSSPGPMNYVACMDFDSDYDFTDTGEHSTQQTVTFTSLQTCGNNITEGTEQCDGTALNGQTCTSKGYTGGTLACNQDCTGFVTSACTSPPPNQTQPQCGNGIIEGTEQCDNQTLGGATCIGRGFASGNLTCKADCTFNTINCISAPLQQCGNRKIEGTEQCDGTNLSGRSCIGQGFMGGTIKCTNCLLDTSGCTVAPTVTATEAQVAITAAQTAIETAREANKNVTEATAMANSAISSFNFAQYDQAKSQAEMANQLALAAPELPSQMPVVLIGVAGVIIATGAAAAVYLLKFMPKKGTGLQPAPPPPPPAP